MSAVEPEHTGDCEGDCEECNLLLADEIAAEMGAGAQPPGIDGWAITIDPGPSNDGSRGIGWTARIWKDGRLILSSTTQAYANAEFVRDLMWDLIAGGDAVLLLERKAAGTERTDVLRSGVGPIAQ